MSASGRSRLIRNCASAGALLLALVTAAGARALPAGLAPADPSAPPAASPKRSSSAIAISDDGAVVLAVNPDSNSLTLVDAATHSVLTELSVGVDPRSVAVAPDGTRAFVANQASDSVSVVDVTAQSVVTEVTVGGRPVGVAVSPDGRLVALAELGDDQVRLLDSEGLTTVAAVSVADRPNGLAFTPDGGRLLVTHLLSGDVTVLTIRQSFAYLPLVLKTLPPGATHVAPVELQQAPRVSWDLIIPTLPNVAPAPGIAVNAAGTRAYLPQTMGSSLGENTRFDTSVFPKVSVLDLNANEYASSEHIHLPERDTPVGLPWDVALTRNDTELWVANAGSNDISILDISNPARPARVAHLNVGDNPRGVVVSPDGGTAYVNNVLQGTVSVVDAGTYSVTAVITVSDIPLPPMLLRGKRLFHSSARSDLAQARWISCNTCHVEGEHDGRTWLLQYVGEVPPGARPVITRNTTSLLGMVETYPLRWSAEWDEAADSEFSVRFEQFGTGLIEGDMHPTLGTPNQGRSYDLDCLAAFIDSLAMSERTHALSAAELRGKAIFEAPETGCSSCHPAPLYTDHLTHDVGTADAYGEWFGPLIDTPSLRFLYDSAPYLHDGSAASMRDVLTTANPNDAHGSTSQLTEGEIEDLAAFLLALPYEE